MDVPRLIVFIAGAALISAEASAGVITAVRTRTVPTWLSRSARILRVLIPLIAALGFTCYGLWVGVWLSHITGNSAASDLSNSELTLLNPSSVAHLSSADRATLLVGRATEHATYATAQSTQGLVLVTAGLLTATLLAAIGFGPERVTRVHDSRQNIEIRAGNVFLHPADAAERSIGNGKDSEPSEQIDIAPSDDADRASKSQGDGIGTRDPVEDVRYYAGHLLRAIRVWFNSTRRHGKSGSG